MFLSEEQKEIIATELGYSRNFDSVVDYLSVEFMRLTVNRINSILERLEAIEAFRQGNLGDTVAVKVGTIELSYNSHYRRLYVEAWHLVNELAALTLPPGLPFTNKYEELLAAPQNFIYQVDYK
ncbi:MAG: hypothetical protein HC878_00310 [Leptolyngbyaceae cyanobacterium SL_5_14]|nr:hypothetical protein [Leptolyngbyaceae cyanobacterium SL_5_14]